jgi:hypothetical protein
MVINCGILITLATELKPNSVMFHPSSSQYLTTMLGIFNSFCAHIKKMIIPILIYVTFDTEANGFKKFMSVAYS